MQSTMVPADRCQSCGFEMTTRELHGTNADGTLNATYCSMCYLDGKIQGIDEGHDMAYVQNAVREYLTGLGTLTPEQIQEAVDIIPGLDRWTKGIADPTFQKKEEVAS